MKIGMIAAMVIGMIALNGCESDAERDIKSKNIVRNQYPEGNVISLERYYYMVIVPGKVVMVECMAKHHDNITDSTVYTVPSKCD